MNWIDSDLNNQHCQDIIRDTQQYHLAQQMRRQHGNPHHSKLLAFLGKLLINVGEKLEKRYGTLPHPESYKTLAATSER